MGARRKVGLAAPPEFVEPCLLTLVDKPPAGERWIHEIKHDGYRLMVRIDAGMVQLLTRSGLDWTDRFPRVAAAARMLPAQNVYLDGEVVVQDDRGHADWPALHACATSGKHCPDAIFWTFGRTLNKVRQPGHPFVHSIGKREYPNAIWVDPVYAAVVDYRGWSGDALLRHGAYKGIVERENVA